MVLGRTMSLEDVLAGSKKRLLLVAHPDDEALFFAGLLLRYPMSYPNVWDVMACSVPNRDPIRAWDFYDSCERLGAKGSVVPYTENPYHTLPWLKTIDLSGYDVIATHGKLGEYGHKDHLALFQYVSQLVTDATRIYSGYDVTKMYEGKYIVYLDDALWARKLDALNAYNHDANLKAKIRTGERLLAEYGAMFDLRRESYDVH